MEGHALTKYNVRSLLRRVTRAGFPADFVRRTVLPDWWDASCEEDPSLLTEVEFRLARFFGLPLSTLRDAAAPLAFAGVERAQLRRVKNVDRDDLAPAIHAGIRVAEAVVRALRQSEAAKPPPRDANAWWSQLRTAHGKVDMAVIATDLWARGIPVVHVGRLPAPKYQGLACVVLGRPVVVLGHEHDAPPRLAFFIAHEAGHISFGDCKPDAPVVDEDEESTDTSEMEARVDSYAWAVLTAGAELPELGGATSWKEIASRATAIEDERGVDAGALVWSWANRTGRFPEGQMALKALYLAQGAQRVLRELFDEHVNVDAASETDLGLLRCVGGGAALDAPAT